MSELRLQTNLMEQKPGRFSNLLNRKTGTALIITAGLLATAGCGDDSDAIRDLEESFASQLSDLSDSLDSTDAPSGTGSEDDDSASAGESSDDGSSDDSIYSSELRDLLTVKDGSGIDCIGVADGTTRVAEVDEIDGEIVVPRLVTSLPLVSNLTDTQDASQQDFRLWSDSIANPIENDEEARTALTEFQNTICESPEVAKMVAHYFRNEVGEKGVIDGEPVIDMNPWLEEEPAEFTEINDQALKLVPGYVNRNSSDEEIIEAVQTHRDLAEKLGLLLERFSNLGIKEGVTTTFNYHLAAGNLQAGSIGEFEENPRQYEGRFIVLKLTAKDGACFTSMLINLDDQRVGETADECVSTPPSTPPTPEEPPTTNPDHEPGKRPSVVDQLDNSDIAGPTPGFDADEANGVVDNQADNDAAIEAGGDPLDVDNTNDGASTTEEDSSNLGGATGQTGSTPGANSEDDPNFDPDADQGGSNGGVVGSGDAEDAEVDTDGDGEPDEEADDDTPIEGEVGAP